MRYFNLKHTHTHINIQLFVELVIYTVLSNVFDLFLRIILKGFVCRYFDKKNANAKTQTSNVLKINWDFYFV